MIVHVGVAVAHHVVLAGNVIISDAIIRQHGTDAEFIGIAIGRMPLVHDIFAKARPIVDAKNAADRAGNGADRSADHGADRAGVTVTLPGALFGAAHGAL